MCGIAGIVAGDARRHAQALERMVQSLRHRGPDANGAYHFNRCLLGHARLSIVDLTSGAQPMLTADGHLGITFNGEIYGFRELKKQLNGFPFKTTSDTEVILALYQKHGPHMMKQLPGMFAFAIWDDREQTLFCARDRFGEKPFYYARGANGEFLFASELGSLLASELIRPKLSRRSLAHYLRRGYVHPTRTIYENVLTLPPGHWLTFRNGEVKVERYWFPPATQSEIKFADAVEEFRARLDKAVERQLVADVEVGAFLSGGLDSSTLVTIAAQKTPKLKTYSFGFEGDFSELPYAKAVAEKNRTEHVELSETGLDIGDLLSTMQQVYDEPFGDSAAIPTYLTCKLARRHVKVVLAGEGADELLGGYRWWYQRYLRMDEAGRRSLALPWLFVGSVGEKAGQDVLRLFGNDAGVKWRKCRNGFYDTVRAIRDRRKFGSVLNVHLDQTSIFTSNDLNALGLTDIPDESAVAKRAWEASGTRDDAMRMDLEDYMPGDILVKTDRAAMAHGLELRSPFLDADFASFCLSLPPEFKLSNGADKLILREAFSAQWPETIRSRGKQGFGAPLDNWLERDSVRALRNSVLEKRSSRIYSFLPFDAVQAVPKDDARKSWLLLVLALWAENHHFDN